jgi:hypothetical protein
VIRFGSRIFYRLTARVLVWLETAGEALQVQFEAGKVERSQLVAYVDAMQLVWSFARVQLSSEAVTSARKKPPSLPVVESPS